MKTQAPIAAVQSTRILFQYYPSNVYLTVHAAINVTETVHYAYQITMYIYAMKAVFTVSLLHHGKHTLCYLLANAEAVLKAFAPPIQVLSKGLVATTNN